MSGRTTPRRPKPPKPSGPASLDLDSIEREGAPGEFTITLGGETYLLVDPYELEWNVLVDAMSGDVNTLLELVVPADQHESFFGTPLPLWKMRKLIDAYLGHYGLGDLGEARALPR